MKVKYSSPSKSLKWNICRRQWYYAYGLRIKPTSVSYTLVTGRTTHQLAELHLRAVYGDGTPVQDWDKTFEALFYENAEGKTIDYPATWSEEDILKMGGPLMRQFPAKWKATGLMPLIDSHGELMVEYPVVVEIAPQRYLRLILDVVAMDRQGQVRVLEFKTPTQPVTPEYLAIAPQLSDQQIAAELICREHGYPPPKYYGEMDFVRRKVTPGGKGPEVMQPVWRGKRSRKAINERRREHLEMFDEIATGRFPRNVGYPFNSPCNMCDFFNYCHFGDDTGLEFPDRRSAPKVRALPTS